MRSEKFYNKETEIDPSVANQNIEIELQNNEVKHRNTYQESVQPDQNIYNNQQSFGTASDATVLVTTPEQQRNEQYSMPQYSEPEPQYQQPQYSAPNAAMTSQQMAFMEQGNNKNNWMYYTFLIVSGFIPIVNGLTLPVGLGFSIGYWASNRKRAKTCLIITIVFPILYFVLVCMGMSYLFDSLSSSGMYYY